MYVREIGSVQSGGTISVDREDWKRSRLVHMKILSAYMWTDPVCSTIHILCTGSDSLTAHSLLLKS